MEAREDPVDSWLAALKARHLSELRFAEVRRAVQALSALYVAARGERLKEGAAFDSAGKRAAYALYFATLHFLTVRSIVAAVGGATARPAKLLDLGCGTGAAAAAWALAAPGSEAPRITGIDRSGWALLEARWTWRTLHLDAKAARGRIESARLGADAIVAAYAINELEPEARAALLPRLLDASKQGASVLIVEPIARAITPWWNDWSTAFATRGGEPHDWRFQVELPPIIAELDNAAGLDHSKLTARSLWLPASPRR